MDLPHERPPMWSTRKELEAALAQAGLGEWSPRLAAAARQTMILSPGPVEEGADAPIGASRLGGMPDLPPEAPWPWRPAISGWTDDYTKPHAERPWPLSFVAQIDFAEIHSAGGLEGFPSSGRLLFFCDTVAWTLGWSSDDKSCASVMFVTEQTDRLGRRDLPVEFSNPGARLYRPKNFILRPRRVTPKLWLLPPPFNSCELLTLDGMPPPPGWRRTFPKCWEAETLEAYAQFWEDFDAEHLDSRNYHQVGGIAIPEAGPVEAACVKYADDDYLNHPPEEEKAFRERRQKDGAPIDWPDYEEWSQAHSAFLDRERASYLERSGNWQLVLQIASDFEIGCESAPSGPWGGEGLVYVCIRKTDLAERRFDRCWTMWQCS